MMASHNPDIAVAKTDTHDRVENIESQPEKNDFSGKMLNADAKLATEAEHSMPLWQGIKTYRKAVFWSVLVSTSIIMEGYDTTRK